MSGTADMTYIGAEIRPGEGVAGRAIRDRTEVVDEHFTRDRFAEGVRSAEVDGADGRDRPAARPRRRRRRRAERHPVRPDASRSRRIEREAGEVLGHQVALAVTNTFLHSDVIEASVRDPLTGLFNRRHLDASIDRFLAGSTPAQRRRRASRRR